MSDTDPRTIVGDDGLPPDTGDTPPAQPEEAFSGAVAHWHLDEALARAPGCVVLPGQLLVTLPLDCQWQLGPGIETEPTEQGQACHAKWLGELVYSEAEGGVSFNVDPKVNISEDELSVQMKLCARSATGDDVETGHVVAALEACGIQHGIDSAAIDAALAQARSGACVEEVLVAKGTERQPSKDARLIINRASQEVGQETAGGRIDFHERDYPLNVAMGESIGYLMGAKPGVEGMTVLGKTLPVTKPKEIQLKLEGLHRDERGKLVVDLDGALLIKGSTLKVVDLLAVSGDVDQRTGNIRSNTPVHVKGHVAPGYELESKKEVIVDQNVEDATVRAGDDIVIKGGIRGMRSQIFAPGDLSVGFVENARIFVNGSVAVRVSVINSTVACNGTIVIGSKQARHSMVTGGELIAHQGVEVMELGSPAFHKTVVRVGLDQESRRQLNTLDKNINEKEIELEQLDKIENYHRSHAKAESLEVMRKVNFTRQTITAELEELKEKHQELMEKIEGASDARVVIHKGVYPGVVIYINDHAYEVKNELGKGYFSLSSETHEVGFHPM